MACAASALHLHEPQQLDNHQPTQSYIYTAQVVLKCLSLTLGSQLACAVRTPLRNDWKILSRENPF